MNPVRCQVAVAIIFVACLAGCRVVQPPSAMPVARPAPSDERTRVVLCERLLEVIWRWDHPDEEWDSYRDWGEGGEGNGAAKLQRRFDAFCRDVGIVPPTGRPLPLLSDSRSAYVYLPEDGEARKRFLELNWALGREGQPRQIAVNLQVFEIPGKLARRWGLDGLPAAGAPPPLLEQGLPLIMEPEEYAVLQSLILDQFGTRLFATASVLTPSGKMATARHVRMQSAPAPGAPPVPRGHAVSSSDAPGVILEATPYAPGCVCWPAVIDVRFQATGAASWVHTSGCGDERTRAVPDVQFVTRAACGMGQTIVLGSTYRSGEACAPLPGGQRQPLLLAFLSMNWSPATPDYPMPSDFVSPSGQLLVLDVPELGDMFRVRRPPGKIDWGDDDDDEEGDDDDDDDDDDGDEESLSPAVVAERAKKLLSSLGVRFSPTGRLFCTNRTLMCFDTEENNKAILGVFSEVSCQGPIPLLCRATAVQLSPELWLKLMLEPGSGLDLRHRVLPWDLRGVVREIEQDAGSRILASTGVTTLSGARATVRDVVRLTGPEAYRIDESRRGGAWIPTIAHRDVGVATDVTLNLAADSHHVGLDIEPAYTALLGWERPSNCPALPQYRSYTLAHSMFMECGTRLMVGGTGGGTPHEPILIWLVSVNRVAWGWRG